ncbi:MAG: altronate dehydratase [Clostridia bacterium]|nr:altronate dehydratase [Clostridia bacterium]
MGYYVINERDNIKVNLENGHKYALRDIKIGEAIIKYGFPIGVATEDIDENEHVHSHNLRTLLSGLKSYTYNPRFEKVEPKSPIMIEAFVRDNGEIGIRNDIWIINTVGCINKTAERIASLTNAFAFPHPYGCSQLGEDYTTTQKILCGLIKHPNAGGVLVLGLGCENNNIPELKKVIGEYDEKRVRFLNIQDCEDEIADAIKIVDELKAFCENDLRKQVPISKLKLGLKCGGSDGLSGITANPLCGKVSDKLISMGGTAVLTEVPEMFGAEQLLMNRCENETVFNKTVELINNYKQYFINHNEPVSENPSPGNKEGGITTLEEKSLGCVQKGGTAIVVDVLDYGDILSKSGLNLLNGPGNDMVAVTNLTAAGCHLILFTTGRGTPLGAPVPTLKIATNSNLANKKPHWIDFDAQTGSVEDLLSLIVETSNGKQSKNELNSYREIAIFKDGVTL